MKSGRSNLRRIIFIGIAAIAAVTILSIVLGSLSRQMEEESRASVPDYNAIFASTIESNRKKLEDPIDYGPRFCTEYVSTKNDIEVHKAILEEVRTISDELCSGAESDYEKIRRLAYWVAENIYYNKVAAEESVDSDTISLETVLGTKTATCAGYSNIFSALCNMQGLYCINLRGGTAYGVFDAEILANQPMNHEWNAVLIDGSWVFVDTTWISPNVYLGYAYSSSEEYLDVYFDMSIERMSYEHRIDLVDHRDFAASVNAFDETGRWSE